MNVLAAAALVLWAARCTTTLDPTVRREYDDYVAQAEGRMPARVAAATGRMRRNISDAALNRRLAPRNGTVIHWMGGVHLPRVTLAEVRAILTDYAGYERIYRPMIFESRPAESGEVILGLHSTFRFVSIIPQHYSFRTPVRFTSSFDDNLLRVHVRAGEIRESDSGVPGRDDFLPPYQDHGILWALNAYWNARPEGDGVYLEFESITLARSAQAFVCRLGIMPVPRSVVASAMDAIPADSVNTVLEGTRRACLYR